MTISSQETGEWKMRSRNASALTKTQRLSAIFLAIAVGVLPLGASALSVDGELRLSACSDLFCLGDYFNADTPGPLTGTVDLSAGEVDFSVAALDLSGSAGTISLSNLRILGTGLAASPDGELMRLDSGQQVQLTGEVGGASFAPLMVGFSGSCNDTGGCQFTLNPFEIANALPDGGTGYFFGGGVTTVGASITTTTTTTTTTSTTVPTTTTSAPTTTTTTTLPPSALDHYKCYQAKQKKKVCQRDLTTECKVESDCTMGGICLQRFPKGVNVALTDQFETVSVEVKKPRNICPPTEKVPQGPPVSNPDLYYKEYQIKGGAKLRLRVLATDQFGDHVLELGGPRFLLLPTHKDLVEPIAAPIPGQYDHYLCRQAKHKKKTCTGDLTTNCRSDGDCAAAGGTCDLGFQSISTQQLDDQFGSQSVEVKKIKYFCTPVVKTPPGLPIVNEIDHLVGYQLKGSDLTETVHTNNQFGPEVVTTKKPKTLYVPALKTLP
jgi:hypothetical protein